jgi:hypothetical protein
MKQPYAHAWVCKHNYRNGQFFTGGKNRVLFATPVRRFVRRESFAVTHATQCSGRVGAA